MTTRGVAVQTQASLDARYVLKAGDTMTGALVVSDGSSGNTITQAGTNSSGVPSIAFGGAGTNVSGLISLKGTGQLTVQSIGNNGNGAIKVQNGAGAASGIQFQNNSNSNGFILYETTTLNFYANNASQFTVTTNGAILPSGKRLQLGNAYVAGAVVPTGTMVIYDSTGTAYRVPCLV